MPFFYHYARVRAIVVTKITLRKWKCDKNNDCRSTNGSRIFLQLLGLHSQARADPAPRTCSEGLGNGRRLVKPVL